MKYIVHLDVYPMIENGKISKQYPMHKMYDLIKDKDVKIIHLNLSITYTKREVEDSKEISPHCYSYGFNNVSNKIIDLSVCLNVLELKNPEFDSDVNVINKILRIYYPDVYKDSYEIVTDYNVFHMRRTTEGIENMMDYVSNKNETSSSKIIPYGQLTANFIMLNMHESDEKIHIIHFDPRSYYTNINLDRKDLKMYIPGKYKNVFIYHPTNMKNKLIYFDRKGKNIINMEQHYLTYSLWLWDINSFDKSKKPKYKNSLQMFVRLNKSLTEISLKAYDQLTHSLFMSGKVDKYHIFTSAENKEKWVNTNEKILKKISPNMCFDFKRIKDCEESGFSYVSLRSKKYPFITPKFLELLSNGIIPLLNIATTEGMSMQEMFPSDIYVETLADIDERMNYLQDPVKFKHLLDTLWERLEEGKQPLLDILGLN